MAVQPFRDARLYSPLPAQHTRLVHASFDDNGCLVARLFLIDLTKDTPGYLAISYTWGDPAQLCDFDVIEPLDNVKYTIQVTQSAVTVITDILQTHSSPRDTAFFFWIDQICIDQSSDSEKMEQIRMMKDIYNKSSKVFAWLGSPSEESDVGMTHIIRLYDSMIGKQYLPTNGATVDLAEFEAVLGSADDPENVKRWEGVLHVLRRPYFLRGWILQEVTVVNDLLTMVICGRQQAVPLIAFERINTFLRTFEMLRLYNELPAFRYLCKNTHQFEAIHGFSRMRLRKNGEPLLFLARRIRRCNVTDPRDKLACMLSFATDVSDADIPYELDYSLSFQSIYAHFAMWSIYKYSNLDIFSDVAGAHRQNQNLPSWVPDWSVPGRAAFTHRELGGDHSSRPLYAASGTYSSDVRIQLPLPSSPTVLRACGIYLSIIHETVPLVGKRVGASWLSEWDFSRFFCDLNNCSMTEVFERTRCADLAARFDETIEDMVYSRRGEVKLPRRAGAALDSSTSVGTCAGKILFGVNHPDDPMRFLLGLCPDYAKRGDLIWMLKGGKMLYILRPRLDLPAGEGVVFDTTGGEHGLTKFAAEAMRFELVGEAFMLGLMDGEILDMIGDNPLREPPPQFRDMDKDFSSVYLI